jgi:hypothetical protein
MMFWAAAQGSDYVGFNFETIWDNDDSVTVPYLQNVSIDPKNYISAHPDRYDFEGEGTEDEPYEIASETDLANVYTKPYAHFIVTENFEVTDNIPTIPELFYGGIDGDEHTISGFQNDGQGLFKTIRNSEVYIKDLTFDGAVISSGSSTDKAVVVGTVATTEDFVLDGVKVTNVTVGANANNTGGIIGSIAAASGSVTIQNCSVSGNISGKQYVGAIVGNASGAAAVVIENCGYSGALVGTGYNGGLVGAATGKLTIGGSYTAGSVSGGNNAYVGGLIGRTAGGVDLSESYSTSSVTTSGTSGDYVGGVVGQIASVADNTVTKVYASSDITASSGSYVGGLIGDAEVAVNISESYYIIRMVEDTVVGNVIGADYVGGLAGRLQGQAIVDKSYATGSVTASAASSYVGGLVGAATGAGSSFTDCYATGDVSGRSYMGGLLGDFNVTASDGAVITRSYARGNVATIGTSSSTYVGGLVGRTAAAVSEVYASGDVTNNYSRTSNGATYTGGLIGYMSAGSSLTDAYALGNVNLASKYLTNSGGLVGYARGNIASAYSAGAVSFVDVGASINAVVGYVYDTSIVLTNLYWNAEISRMFDETADANATMLLMAGTPASGYAGFAFGPDGVWENEDEETLPYLQNVTIDPKNYIDSYPGHYNFAGAGTLSSPYEIWDEEDFANVYTAAYAHFKVMDDIEITAENIPTISALVGGGIDGNGKTITGFKNNDRGFIGAINDGSVYIKNLTFKDAVISGSNTNTAVVIGRLSTDANFVLDGVNVVDATMTGSYNNTGGLIGSITNTVGTVTIQNCTVSGSIVGGSYVGAIVGNSSGAASITIDNCSYNGALSGVGYNGGLVGRAAGKLTITDSYTTGSVSGSDTYAGGLVGMAAGGAVFLNSYSASNISTSSNNYVGGVAGAISTSENNAITKVYASGNITTGSAQYVGGLVGSATSVAITDVYALGDITASSTNSGGLIGYLSGGSVTNAYSAGAVNGGATIGAVTSSPNISNLYWQVDTSHLQSATYGQPIRTLYEPSSEYAGFDFDDVWAMTQGSAIPYLQGLGIDAKNNITTIRKYAFAGEGLESTPYLVGTLADFNEIRNNQHAYYQLTEDIDLTGLAQMPDIWYGGIDGNNKTISNFTLAAATTGGLFANLTHKDIFIKNLTLNNFSLVGTASTRGLIAGQITATGVVLDKITVDNGAVKASSGSPTYYGGLVGQVTATGGVTVQDCNVNIAISGNQYTGGLVGGVTDGGSVVVDKCDVAGSIAPTGTYSGGLIGYASGGLIDRSHTDVTITATGGGSIGGLVGYNSGSAVTNSDTTGNITSSGNATTGNYVGGLIGYNNGSAATVTNSYATGNVSSSSVSPTTNSVSSYTGGLVGRNVDGTINLVFARGNVSVTASSCNSTYPCGAGGLIGENSGGAISQGYASGNVSVTGSTATYVGGLIGNNSSGVINDVYVLGDVKAGSTSTQIGGIIANFAGGTIDNAYSIGKVTSNSVPAAGKAVFGAKNGTASHIYWLVSTSGISTDAYAAPVYLPTDTADYVGFDFTDIWENIDGGTVPYFQNLAIDDKNYIEGYMDDLHVFEGQGTVDEPYLLKTAEDVAAMYENPFAHYKVAEDIDMTGHDPILPLPASFSGSLDGDEKTISNLTVRVLEDNAGLFSGISSNDVVIKDLTLANISYTGNYNNVGGLIGNLSADNYTLENINVTGGISSTGSGIGGLVGNYSAVGGKLTIRGSFDTETSTYGCSSSVNFTNGSYLGGVVGRADVASEVVIDGCTFDGSMTVGGSYHGGLVGSAGKVTLTNVTTTGMVVGNTYVGGLAGDIQGGSITNAVVSGDDLWLGSTGTVYSESYYGGLVGRSTAADINIDTVTVSKNIIGFYGCTGGLIGYVAGNGSTGTISKAIMTGNITENSASSGSCGVGGLIGQSYSTITLNISESNVTGKIISQTDNNVGGLIGRSYNDTLTNVFSLSNITGTGSSVGGLIGYASGVTMSEAYSAGQISSLGTSRQATVGGQAAGANSFANIYWNVESSQVLTDTVGTPIRTSYAPEGAYVGFDFENTWEMIQDVNIPQYTLPYLKSLGSISEGLNISEWVKYGLDGSGKGFEGEPYLIRSSDDLNNMRYSPYAYYKIALPEGEEGEEKILTLSGNWTPIPQVCGGGIDGNGTTLRGLSVVATADNNGFIASVGCNDEYTIHDWKIDGFSSTGNFKQKGFIGAATDGTLTVDNVDFSGGSINPATKQANTGTVLGQVNGATVNILNVDTDLEVNGAAGTGGLVGIVTSGAVTLTSNNQSGTVKGTTTKVGGLIGEVTSGAVTLTDNNQYGNVVGTTAVGGLIGLVTAGTTTISESNQFGNVSGTGTLGGYVGSISTSGVVSVDGGVMSGSVTGNTSASGTYVGGIVGYSIATTGVTIEDVDVCATEKKDNGDIVCADEEDVDRGVIAGYSYIGGVVGKATVGGVMINGVSSNYNIDSKTTNSGGLVGSTTGGKIEGSYATGEVKGTSTLGGLLGTSVDNAITITDSYATGDVTGTQYIGGLVGDLGITSSSVTSSYASGDVTSTSTYVGGLIGRNYAALSKVYASGAVSVTTATAAIYTGGLVGRHYTSLVSDAFAVGNVSTSLSTHTYVGGLIGRTDTSGTFSNVYYGGVLSGTIGTPNTHQILIGSGGTLTTVSGAYWYSDISGYGNPLNNDGIGDVSCGTNVICGKAVTKSSTAADFIEFNFDTVWDMDTDENGDSVSMPYLRGMEISDKVKFNM